MTTTRIRSSSAVVMTAILAASLAIPTGLAGAQQQRPRQVVPMDSARAAELYVSNRHEDHPQANFAAQIAAKAITDSIFQARSKGVMDYRKTSYKSGVDGMEIPVYVYAPLEKKGNRGHAALVWVHGGVHGNWDQDYLPFIKEAVAKGYVVVAPEYRGSTGYGPELYNAIDYGVAIVPVTNLFQRLSYKGPGYQRSFSTQKEVLGLPFENREEYKKRSPYYHVDSLRTPILVHVATNDADVNFEEAQPLIDALRARKPELSETKVYVDPTPGPFSVGHSFSRRVNPETLERDDSPEQIDSWNLAWAFLEKWVKPDGR